MSETNTKQLELLPDTTGFIIMGKGEARQKMEKEVIENPIMCGPFSTPRKTKDWLGDLFHEDGLSASVNATILERTPQAKAAMFEIKVRIEAPWEL